MAQRVKNLHAMQETQETRVQSLGWEDPLEEEMATHSTILAWKIPWTEEPGRLQSKGSQRVGHDWSGWTSTHVWLKQERLIFSQFLEAGSPGSEYQKSQVLERLSDGCLLTVSHMAEKMSKLSGLSYKDTNATTKSSPRHFIPTQLPPKGHISKYYQIGGYSFNMCISAAHIQCIALENIKIS